MSVINEPQALLTESFLNDLYQVCLHNTHILAVVATHVERGYLPDADYQAINRVLKAYWHENNRCPSMSVVQQELSSRRSAYTLFTDIATDRKSTLTVEDALTQLERYIKQVRFQQAYAEAASVYNSKGWEAGANVMREYTEWSDSFSLQTTGFVDVVENALPKLQANKTKTESNDTASEVNRFYIDELDQRNNCRSLRGQLTCFLASTGVGKSHIARHIGKNACMVSGLNVLHFQLEGSEDEVVNAYGASFLNVSAYDFEMGNVSETDMETAADEMKAIKGRLFVKSYPKFNNNVSTADIFNGIQDFKRHYKLKPDIIIIDSMDLLTDASGRTYTEKGERMKRIKVANELKDMASDENLWVVVTYQSTIENQEWLNDEKNVLTAYNTSEAKGISRPLTHLISLNQSAAEDKENIMRIHVAKSRFFKKGEAFPIATDYEHERFYDPVRTMNLDRTVLQPHKDKNKKKAS